jgi:Inner membrane component of T3SS, cytoplasmic domain
MSFKLFIYYCALCGGWAAFLAWVIVCAIGGLETDPRTLFGGHPFLKTALIAGALGLLVAAGVGAVDAILNAVGNQRLTRVAVCAGVGFLGGLLGGVIGEALHQISPYLYMVGWMLAGAAIGASIGVYDLFRAMSAKMELRAAVKKTLNGVYGGLIGALVGGLPFVLLPDPTGSTLHSGLTLGFVILGLCIGLLIGLAQVFLKEAWLKVESGFRPGREVMLSKDETTIGRAESCDLALFGDNAVERTHARIQLKEHHYVLADAETPGGTFLNGNRVKKPVPLRDGDSIGVGNSVLRFGERQKRS